MRVEHRRHPVIGAAVAALALAGGASCSADEAQDPWRGWCERASFPSQADPAAGTPPLCADDYGSGRHGRWELDAWGAPLWRVLTPAGDPAWSYPTSRGESRAVWHAFGNDALNAFAHLDGAIELFTYPRSGQWLNKRHAAAGHDAGGWSELVVGGRVERIGGGAGEEVAWGENHVRVRRTLGDLEVTRTVFFADALPSVNVELRVQNRGERPLELALRHRWEVALAGQTLFPLASGEALDAAWTARLAAARQAFELDVHHRPAGISAQLRLKPDREAPAGVEPLTQPILLRADADSASCHDGTLASGCPAAATDAVLGAPLAALELERRYTVAPGAAISDRHRFGYGDWAALDGAEAFPTFAQARDAAQPAAQRERLTLSVPGMPWVARETAWHSRQLVNLALRNERWDIALTDQGSAYLYSQGASGAVRDWAITALALIPYAPERARDMLRLVIGFGDETGHLHYMMVGRSEPSEGGLHGESTDLDLWLLWGVAEYVLATRDFAWLAQPLPAYPPERAAPRSVLEHLRLHLQHLREVTGTGEHGMIRVGTGDWSDGVILFAPDNGAVVADGESGFNTGMAVHVLPRVAEAVRAVDPELAAACETFAAEQSAALEQGWQGDRYLRGWDGLGGVIGAERFFLEPQVFPLLAGHGGPARGRALVEALDAQLDQRSAIGAVNVHPPQADGVAELLVPGWDVNGGVWAALGMLLTAGYAQVDPERAWRAWQEHSFANHAETYPELWFGVTSGPDAYNADDAQHPGATYWHPATSMAEFPVTNSNAHAGPLVAAMHLAGLVPDAAGWRLDPHLPLGSWRLDSPLVQLVVDQAGLAARFSTRDSAPLAFTVRLPPERVGATGVEGLEVEGGWVRFSVAPESAASEVRWRLRWE